MQGLWLARPKMRRLQGSYLSNVKLPENFFDCMPDLRWVCLRSNVDGQDALFNRLLEYVDRQVVQQREDARGERFSNQYSDENFVNLLRAEELATMPEQLATLIKKHAQRELAA